MHLENIKIRVKKYSKGYSVEIEKEKPFWLFWKTKYWIHLESVSGMSDKAWCYSTKEIAISEAVKHFEWDLIYYSE